MREGELGHRQRTMHIGVRSKLGRQILQQVVTTSAKVGPKAAGKEHGISESTVRRWIDVWWRTRKRAPARRTR